MQPQQSSGQSSMQSNNIHGSTQSGHTSASSQFVQPQPPGQTQKANVAPLGQQTGMIHYDEQTHCRELKVFANRQ